ncbi:rRNA-processing protein LAS1 [Aspergillus stella-maris]|uniref:rRNA-processing protein LAS1 n=1 Tax=Aspergillus stella-maris TaxID=1810926 RepID=UPI003CCE2ACD
MVKVIFTPWKHTSELLTVRSQFYPAPEYEGPDLRDRACATVSAWKLRGNLPHPIEATALLTDSILHDDARKNSVFSIRATYAAAFCRFVTGLVDSKLGARRSMFSRALELGLPASFVELRHEATHRELPSLVVLRGAVARSLEWLWGFYWAGVGSPGPSSMLAQGVEGVERDVRAVLEDARGLIDGSASGSANGSGSEPPRKRRRVQQELGSLAGRVVSIVKQSRDAEGVFAREMVRDGGVLVPGGRRLNDPLTEPLTKWTPFLQQITEGHHSFLGTLIETMVDELAFSSSSPSHNKKEKTEKDPHSEAIYKWLDHILHLTQWESHRRFLSLSYIKAVCDGSENHWTKLLQKSLGKANSELNGVPSISKAVKSKTQSSSEETGPSLVDEDIQALSRFGWGMTYTWDERPVGMA